MSLPTVSHNAIRRESRPLVLIPLRDALR